MSNTNARKRETERATPAPSGLEALLAEPDAGDVEKRGYERGWNDAMDEFKVNEPLRSDHPAIEQARAEGRAEADAAWVAKVNKLHAPIRVYDECEHDADHGCDPIEVYDYMGCSESVIGWGCPICCYDDEYPREDCPHGADHRGVTREQSCPTRALIPADAATALAARDAKVRRDALNEAADKAGLALGNEVGGHTSTYSVRDWLRDLARQEGER